eukprot:2818807-Rhodomonas_salina.1
MQTNQESDLLNDVTVQLDLVEEAADNDDDTREILTRARSRKRNIETEESMQRHADTDTAYRRAAMDLSDKQERVEQLTRTPDALQIEHEHAQRVAIEL